MEALPQNEIASTRGVGIRVEEAAIPVAEVVRGACEILGLDPLYVANEGCFVIFVPAAQEREALDILSAIPVSPGAVLTGSVVDSSKAGPVVLKNKNRVHPST